jgi:hypothetical protein
MKAMSFELVASSGVAQIGVLDSRCSATGQESDRRAGGAAGATEAIRTPAEVVDQGVVPVAEELADDPDPGAAGIDPVVELLRHGRRTVGMVVVAAGVEVHAAGDRDAILFVDGADRRPVVGHVDDRIGRRGGNLDRCGSLGVGDAGSLGIGVGRLGVSACRRRGIGSRLLLQLVELLLHQAQLLLQ